MPNSPYETLAADQDFKLERIEIVEEKDTFGGKDYKIQAVWSGVDRAVAHGYVTHNRQLAQRMRRAMEAGVIIKNPRKCVDKHGKTYVSYNVPILWRCANAELKRLGF